MVYLRLYVTYIRVSQVDVEPICHAVLVWFSAAHDVYLL